MPKITKKYILKTFSNNIYKFILFLIQALKNLLDGSIENPKNDDLLSLAIEVVAAAKDNSIDEEFIKLLLGEIDGHARVYNILNFYYKNKPYIIIDYNYIYNF